MFLFEKIIFGYFLTGIVPGSGNFCGLFIELGGGELSLGYCISGSGHLPGYRSLIWAFTGGVPGDTGNIPCLQVMVFGCHKTATKTRTMVSDCQ
jgi:hypothetical protein